MSRKILGISFFITAITAIVFMTCGQSSAAIYNTDEYSLTGKVEAKTAFFTGGAHGNTCPQYDAWDMFKQRNLAYIEWTHDLQRLTGLDLQYHIVGRGLYEGVYDYGPVEFRTAYNDNKEAYDRYDLRYQARIWEAYAHYRTGPVNIRIGKQNLSWGNTDIMRVVDHINPLDNTWGGTGTESLDDRRIPLWMIRTGYQASNTFGVEGYLVPGAIDATVAPNAPWGSPYAFPEPDLRILSAAGITIGFNNSLGYINEPKKDMSSSRLGLKLLLPGILGGNNSNVELSYQRTYWDTPALRFLTDKGVLASDPVWYGNPGVMSIEMEYPKVNIFGLSANYNFADLDFIIKGDIAHVQGATVYINDINQPTAYFNYAGLLLPQVTTGQFTYRDFTNIGISFEKNVWIRSINRGEKVQFLFEYYGNYCHSHDSRMIYPIPDPDSGGYASMGRYEHTLALSITSEYNMKTKINLVTLYNPSGSWMIAPTLTYRFDNPFTIAFGYSTTFGNWVMPFAYNQDRDQINALLKYEF